MTAEQDSILAGGTLRRIIQGDDGAPGIVVDPIFQCLTVRSFEDPNGDCRRFRVVLSDGDHFIQCLLPQRASSLAETGQVRKGIFMRVKSYIPNTVYHKRVLLILDFDVLVQHGERAQIGRPVRLPEAPLLESPSSHPRVEDRSVTPPTSTPALPGTSPRTCEVPGPPVADARHAALYPIEGVSPYLRYWSIRARCTDKSPVKEWRNRNGEGKLFGVTLLDRTGAIRATAFNQECDRLHAVFRVGRVYYISTPCQVQLARRSFSRIQNEYELTFDAGTVVEETQNTDDDPPVQFSLTPIADLAQTAKDTLVDVIGVLTDVSELSHIAPRSSSKVIPKREVSIIDRTEYSVRLTTWGGPATRFDVPVGSVIVVKDAKVSDFGGRSLSLPSSSSLVVDPDTEDAHRLKEWYDDVGSYAASRQLSSTTVSVRNPVYTTIQQVTDEKLGVGPDADFFTLKGTISLLGQETFAYPACLSHGCAKKVVEVASGEWRCERCCRTHPRPEYRYVLSVNVADHTGQLWMTAFDAAGRSILGTSADDLHAQPARQPLFAAATYQTLVFRVRAKMESYADQTRVRYHIMNARPVDVLDEANRLAEIIQSYNVDPAATSQR